MKNVFVKWFKDQGKKILSFFYTKREIYIEECDLTRFCIRSDEVRTDVVCHSITESDLRAIAESLGSKFAQSAKKKLKLGYGFAAVDNGRIVGYTWLLTKDCRNEGEFPFFYDIHPKEKSVYISGSYVIPEKRNQVIARKVFISALNQMKELGYEMAFTTRDSRNFVVKPILSRCGFHCTGAIHYRRIMGIHIKNLKSLNRVSRRDDQA